MRVERAASLLGDVKGVVTWCFAGGYVEAVVVGDAEVVVVHAYFVASAPVSAAGWAFPGAGRFFGSWAAFDAGFGLGCVGVPAFGVVPVVAVHCRSPVHLRGGRLSRLTWWTMPRSTPTACYLSRCVIVRGSRCRYAGGMTFADITTSDLITVLVVLGIIVGVVWLVQHLR